MAHGSTCVHVNGTELGSSLDPWASYDFKTKEESAICSEYFREHAHIRLRPEQRLANGVSWRLQVDDHTRTRIPRITWMSDHRSLLLANRMFEMVHGKAIFDAGEFEAKWLKLDKSEDSFAADVSNVYDQGEVELTFAGQRFVSYREIGIAAQSGSYYTRFAKSQVLDLEHGTFSGVEACPRAKGPYGEGFPDYDWNKPESYKEAEDPAVRYFIFGSLLRLCDEERFRTFRAFAVKWAKAAIPAEDASRSPQADYCSAWAWDLATKDLPMRPVLGVSGLVLYDLDAPRGVRSYRCPSGAFQIDPVVIPYRELAPLMIPGPLRDELLALH
jgi:hypothetical protein